MIIQVDAVTVETATKVATFFESITVVGLLGVFLVAAGVALYFSHKRASATESGRLEDAKEYGKDVQMLAKGFSDKISKLTLVIELFKKS